MEINNLPPELQSKVDECVQYCHDKQNHLLPHIAMRPVLEAWVEKYWKLQQETTALQARCDRYEKANNETMLKLITYIRENYKPSKEVWKDKFGIALLSDEGILGMFNQLAREALSGEGKEDKQ